MGREGTAREGHPLTVAWPSGGHRPPFVSC